MAGRVPEKKSVEVLAAGAKAARHACLSHGIPVPLSVADDVNRVAALLQPAFLSTQTTGGESRVPKRPTRRRRAQQTRHAE